LFFLSNIFSHSSLLSLQSATPTGFGMIQQYFESIEKLIVACDAVQFYSLHAKIYHGKQGYIKGMITPHTIKPL